MNRPLPTDERITEEMRSLAATLTFKPLWLADLVDWARALLQITH
jgi:hypothetical protein